MPTFVDIAGGPKGDGLKKQIEAGQYPGIVKTTLDGVDQTDYLDGKSEKSARDYLLLLFGRDPSAVRYKNWKMYFAMSRPTRRRASSLPLHPVPLDPGRTTSSAIPSRQAVGSTRRRPWAWAARSAARRPPSMYDWNMLPIGQQLWLKELETYKEFPPLQDPASYNLEQVMEQVKKANASHASD